MHCRWYPSMPCNRSRGGGGCYPSMHCRWYPSMPCSRAWGGLLSGVCSGGGLLLWSSVMPFCYGLLAPSQRPYQKATKPEGHNRRGVPGGDLPSSPGTGTAAGGTHPTGMHSCITIVSFLVHMSLLIPSDVYFALRRMYIAASCSW